MNCKEAKEISVIDFLKKNGYLHVYIQGYDYWYKSPLRNEKNPSFKVNSSKNLWFDFGIGDGGDIIKLTCLLFNTDYSGALKKLSRNNYSIQSDILLKRQSSIVISRVDKLSNTNLLQYLLNRKINNEVANKFCKEVHFQLNGKDYYAVGFQNNSGGYELRNKYFKGCSSPKDITLISNGHNKVIVFEGFMDFLSWFSCDLYINDEFDYIILNTLTYVNKGIQILKQYDKAYFFLDNDEAGKRSTKEIMRIENLNCIDMSIQYSSFKDLNDYLTNKKA